MEEGIEVVEEVRCYYAQRVGEDELDQLENQLRVAVNKIGLEYLPESWVEQSN